ncbi:DUF2314 domain-containing protein [Motilimonas cestriensis]|uniref:DUF2314 domain-containing protein n=1 Tax=Motilimonas cestriensis TaxID=2742685 RepID=A0ABS8WDL9_9GAMM|nr:DUF2314 domain-containing protein [Motilimonas cestriensis]MCE2596363.1 DUF2314 domain-containing protein [Motilimonas cestriensis]
MKHVLSFLVVVLSTVGISFASSVEPDIRYRTIIYYYPEKVDIDTSLLVEKFKQFDMVDELPESASKPVLSHKIIKDLKASYPVPDASYLAYFGRGLDKGQVTRIEKSNLAIIIDIAYPYNLSFAGLREATNSLYQFSESSGGVIWDSETRELFTPLAWKEQRIDSWGGSMPNVRDHTVIHAYKNNEGVRAITLGMVKFGLPDIVVNDFSWSSNRSMGSLINLVAQSIAEGASLTKDGDLELNIGNLVETEYKTALIPTLKKNAESKLLIQTGEGKWEEGDPNNYIIELLFQNIKGKSLSEKHESLLSSLFGSEDNISYVQHNSLIMAASQRAKEKLNGLRSDFNEGLDPGKFIQVKAPFTTPEGGTEWMWVEVLSWKDNVITGLLKNEPYSIPNLKGGAEVTVNQTDIFDYIINFPDGTSEGNETGALIEKYQK